jgi:hypothetical protein
VTTDDELQLFAVEVHTVEMQVHAAEPLVPVQLWWVPGHATGAPYDQHPLLPRTHVARLPDTHCVCPCEQLSVHVSEQAALGAIPAQDSGF